VPRPRPTSIAALALGVLALCLCGTAAAQTPSAPFQILATTKVGPQPGKITYGYGAVWTLNANGSVSRLDTTTGEVRTTSVGPNVRDLRAGYNRIWVLRSTKTTATLVRLNTSNAARVGNDINIPLGTTVDVSPAINGANTLGIGSSFVWASLKILTSFGVGAATGGTAGALSLTSGASFLWLSQATPNDLGQINKISPSSGLVKGAVSTGLDIGLTCTAAGAGAVWATEVADAAGGEPALLVRLSQTDLSEVARDTLPPGANPGAVKCLVAGGGLVWVSDGVGSVTTIQP
jgi:hypothetical protein